MIDKVTIFVKAGDGGKGCDSRVRISKKKWLFTGGEGGAGGNIMMRADSNVATLENFLYHRHFSAESGTPGGSNHRKGKKAEGLLILVPCGTTLFRKEKHLLIRDLVHPGEEVRVAEGGRGGASNAGGREAQPGGVGEHFEVTLILKIPAEVFFVGLPNVGKSKLLNRLTHAHAKEGHYPFSTKHPELGIYETPSFEQIRLCELPGLYRESFQGRGAGVDFLQHLTRARMILLMLDPLNPFATSLQEGYDLFLEILGRYDSSLLETPRAVAVNKMNLSEARERFAKEKFRPRDPFFLISAETGEGLEPLMRYIVQKLKELPIEANQT